MRAMLITPRARASAVTGLRTRRLTDALWYAAVLVRLHHAYTTSANRPDTRDPTDNSSPLLPTHPDAAAPVSAVARAPAQTLRRVPPSSAPPPLRPPPSPPRRSAIHHRFSPSPRVSHAIGSRRSRRRSRGGSAGAARRRRRRRHPAGRRRRQTTTAPAKTPRPVADPFPRRFRRLHQPRPPRRRGL